MGDSLPSSFLGNRSSRVNYCSVSTFGSTEVASFPGCNRRGETVSFLGLYPGNKAAIGGIHVFEQVFVSSQESPQRIPIKVQR